MFFSLFDLFWMSREDFWFGFVLRSRLAVFYHRIRSKKVQSHNLKTTPPKTKSLCFRGRTISFRSVIS